MSCIKIITDSGTTGLISVDILSIIVTDGNVESTYSMTFSKDAGDVANNDSFTSAMEPEAFASSFAEANPGIAVTATVPESKPNLLKNFRYSSCI